MIGKVFSEYRGLAVVLTAFFVLGVMYGTVTPLFETPDEIQHYFHVKHIADGKGLPVLKPQGEALYGQEGGQPSLYYLLGAATTFWIDTSDAEELLEYNPYVTLGVASPEGNKNVILHTDRERFPYRGTTLAVHVLRWLSLLLGLVTVLTTYLLSLQLFPGQKVLALGAAALTAFNPTFIFTNAAVSNDSLLIALSSLALLSSVLLLRRGPSMRRFVCLGLVVGLAAVTKLTGLGLAAVVFYTLVVLALRYSLKDSVKGGLIVLGLVGLLAGWWYVRNLALYHDPTGMSAFLDALGGSIGRNLPLRRIVRELEGFKLSYWAVFGWLNVLAASWVYRFFALLVVLGVIGLPLALAKALRAPRGASFSSLGLMFIWMVVIAAGYVRYNQMISAATGRLVFPAISCFSVVLSWGLFQLAPRQYARVFVGVLAATLLLVAVICPFRYIAPAYARPAPLDARQVQSIPNLRNVDYGGQMKLLGHDLDGRAFRPAEVIDLTLYWQALRAMDKDYSVSIVLLTPDGELIGQEDSYPGLGNFPTSAWRPGETIADQAWVRVRPRTATPTIGWVGVNLYYLPTMERLTAREGGAVVDQVFLQPIKIVPWPARQYIISNPLQVDLGNQVDLIGYDLGTSEARPGEAIALTLYWEASQDLDQDYTVFTHVIDYEDHVWAQKDSQPLGGNYPTSFWDAGDVVCDPYEITLPMDVPAGHYGLEVGLYLASTGERLSVLDEKGEIQENRVLLETVTVTH